MQHGGQIVLRAGLARVQAQVVRAARVAGGFHAQLARRVAAQKVARHAAGLHHLARRHAHAFAVKRGAATAAGNEGVFSDFHVSGKHGLAQRAGQEGVFAVERAAADGLHEVAQQARRQGRLEKHGAFARADFSRAHAAERALGGVAAHGFGAGQAGGVAFGAEPAVALHGIALARDDGDGKAVARAGVAAAKAVAVGAEKVALLGRNAGAFAVADVRAGLQRGLLAGQR